MSHILPPDAYYRTRRVPCREGGRYHRHRSHVEEFTFAICGAEVLRGTGAVNLTIFSPNMKGAWCFDCYGKSQASAEERSAGPIDSVHKKISGGRLRDLKGAYSITECADTLPLLGDLIVSPWERGMARRTCT